MALIKIYFGQTFDFFFNLRNSSLSIIMALSLDMLSKYIYSDFTFLGWLGVMAAIDTITGIYAAIKKKEFNFKKLLTCVFEKFFTYASLLVMANSFSKVEINGVAIGFLNYVDDVICSGLFIREGLSVFENIVKIRPELASLFEKIKGLLPEK